MQQPDGSYFIDADPDLFAHILRFLRQGTFPLFLKGKSFDYSLYSALLDCARFFQVINLEGWLENEKYRNMVTAVHTVHERCGPELFSAAGNFHYADEEMEFHPSLHTREAYVCPRNDEAHTSPKMCGRACERTRGDRELEYKEEQYWSALVVRKAVKIHNQNCASVRCCRC